MDQSSQHDHRHAPSTSSAAALTAITCTRPYCRASFEVESDRLGKNLFCDVCGALITAVPAGISRPRSNPPRRLPLEAMLVDVRSLWNVGSMFRSADGAGVRRLHLVGITGRPPRKEITKTALGAELDVPWQPVDDACHHARRLQASGLHLIAVERTERSRSIHSLEVDDLAAAATAGVCLIVGNEVAGIAPRLLDLAPLHIELPMRGAKESLNVAVAFGIAAYAVAALLEKVTAHR